MIEINFHSAVTLKK